MFRISFMMFIPSVHVNEHERERERESILIMICPILVKVSRYPWTKVDKYLVKGVNNVD